MLHRAVGQKISRRFGNNLFRNVGKFLSSHCRTQYFFHTLRVFDNAGPNRELDRRQRRVKRILLEENIGVNKEEIGGTYTAHEGDKFVQLSDERNARKIILTFRHRASSI